ncbi:MAG TPA: EAL domain-containing protein [Gammaproteobacteria bacterium]
MRVLLVEDDHDDATFLKACLRRQGSNSVNLVRVERMAEAIDRLQGESFDIVLLDLNLPDSRGQDSVHRIQSTDPSVPIVVLSGDANEEFAIQILNRGVQDFLVKWEGDGRTILRSIRYAVERKRAEERLSFLAQYDPLTEIPNRRHFADQLGRATTRARRGSKKIGVLFLDLDRFKAVNDTLGHQSGDALLGMVVERLKTCVRTGDLLARLGGDEFAFMLEDVEGPLALEAAAKNILSAFDKPFQVGPRQVSTTASVGITVYPNDTTDPMALLNNADMAMYKAKEDGRNTFKFFEQRMHEEIMQYHQLETDLGKALERDEFALVYQPQIGLVDNKIHALEALLRWNHPEQGLVLPSEFISVAEESGHIVPIGLWVLERVCKQIKEWQRIGMPMLRVAINIAPANFEQPDFHRQVEATLGRYGVEPGLVELELTEGTLMRNTDSVQDALRKLKLTGVRLSVDDFGTGHSCLSYLRQFPIDVLKIDRSFVMDLGRNEHGTAICGLVLSIARSLNLEVVAEGVENETQLAFLNRHNCEYAQGQLFSMPVSPDELPALYRKRGTTDDHERLSDTEVSKALSGI